MPWGSEAQLCQIKIEVSICFIVFPHQSGAVCLTALLANNKGYSPLEQTSPPGPWPAPLSTPEICSPPDHPHPSL